MGSCRSFFSWIVVVVIFGRTGFGRAPSSCPPLNEVMLMLPPVQFGNSRYRLFVTHVGCGQGYCSRRESPLTRDFLQGFRPSIFGRSPCLSASRGGFVFRSRAMSAITAIPAI